VQGCRPPEHERGERAEHTHTREHERKN
jgi:hypothetical protein